MAIPKKREIKSTRLADVPFLDKAEDARLVVYDGGIYRKDASTEGADWSVDCPKEKGFIKNRPLGAEVLYDVAWRPDDDGWERISSATGMTLGGFYNPEIPRDIDMATKYAAVKYFGVEEDLEQLDGGLSLTPVKGEGYIWFGLLDEMGYKEFGLTIIFEDGVNAPISEDTFGVYPMRGMYGVYDNEGYTVAIRYNARKVIDTEWLDGMLRKDGGAMDGYLKVNNNIRATGNIEADGAGEFGDNVRCRKDLQVDGTAKFKGNITSEGSIKIKGSLEVRGPITVDEGTKVEIASHEMDSSGNSLRNAITVDNDSGIRILQNNNTSKDLDIKIGRTEMGYENEDIEYGIQLEQGDKFRVEGINGTILSLSPEKEGTENCIRANETLRIEAGDARIEFGSGETPGIYYHEKTWTDDFKDYKMVVEKGINMEGQNNSYWWVNAEKKAVYGNKLNKLEFRTDGVAKFSNVVNAKDLQINGAPVMEKVDEKVEDRVGFTLIDEKTLAIKSSTERSKKVFKLNIKDDGVLNCYEPHRDDFSARDWWKSSLFDKTVITKVSFVDNYEKTGLEDASWDSTYDDVDNCSPCKCYLVGTEIIVDVGSGYTLDIIGSSINLLFFGFSNLKEIDGLEKLDFFHIIQGSSAFGLCYNLSKVDLTGYNAILLDPQAFGDMFNDCGRDCGGTTIYVKDQAMADFIKATSHFPSNATVIIKS